MKYLKLQISTNNHREEYSLEELNCALTEVKCNKAPGEYNVSTELFKCSGIAFKEKLLTSLSEVLHGENPPENCQKTTVMSLFKK